MSLQLKNSALLRESAPIGGRWIDANATGIVATNPAMGEVTG